jgi:hypothetical protein
MSQVQTGSVGYSGSGAALGAWYGEFHRRQPVLTAFAFLMIAAMAPTLLALALEIRTYNGINVWMKPFKFELSTAVHMATLAWFWGYLDDRFRVRRGMQAAAWIVGLIFAVEVGYIAYRAAFAEGSHFNNSTTAAAIAYPLMGVGILITIGVTTWIGILVLRSREGGISPTLRLAIGLGLIGGSLLGAISGGYMSAQPGHWVGGAATDAGGVPLFGWSRTGGDLRVAHFVGLHAMQGIPVIGYLVQRSTAGPAIVWASLAAWVVVTAGVFVLGIQGRSIWPL